MDPQDDQQGGVGKVQGVQMEKGEGRRREVRGAEGWRTEPHTKVAKTAKRKQASRQNCGILYAPENTFELVNSSEALVRLVEIEVSSRQDLVNRAGQTRQEREVGRVCRGRFQF